MRRDFWGCAIGKTGRYLVELLKKPYTGERSVREGREWSAVRRSSGDFFFIDSKGKKCYIEHII